VSASCELIQDNKGGLYHVSINEKLQYYPISHAFWKNMMQESLGRKSLELGVVRYFRFNRQVRLNSIKIYPVDIRWAPSIVGQPAHVLVSVYDDISKSWVDVLNQNLPEFNVNTSVHVLDLNGLQTDHVRIVCDREHLVQSSHGEQWERQEIVPFKILDRIEFYGEIMEEKEREPIYNPPLKLIRVKPVAPDNMKVTMKPEQITFSSRYFSVSFSLRRPIITHLGWDDMGKGLSKDNLILTKSIVSGYQGFCGPVLQSLKYDVLPIFWTGEVEVDGNIITYKNLKAVDDYVTNLTFEIHEKGMLIHVSKEYKNEMLALEADDWRFLWDAEKCITGTLGMPIKEDTRTGVVSLPAIWNAPGHGTISIMNLSSEDNAQLQSDSWRDKKIGWSGLTIGVERDIYGALKLKKGTHHAIISLEVKPLLPKLKSGVELSQVPEGILRNWSTAFTFRSELAGFSNNSVSTNCHMSQFHLADIVPYTSNIDGVPTMTELLRYTVELSLKGGPGYGARRDLYMDSDPSILICVGTIQRVEPNIEWIREMWSYIKQVCERMLSNTDETGLIVCRSLTGNSGSKRWSSNAWDVVSFGHYDAYSSALAYRALKNIVSVASLVGDDDMSQRCDNAANMLKKNYKQCFLNPGTGVIAGWRSADGRLHDYMFTFINYMAVCFDLVEGNDALSIMNRLEEKMDEMGFNYFYYGIPSNLISIRNEDAPTEMDYKRADGLDRYGIYVNGSLTTVWMQYYIDALAKCGLKNKANLVCSHLEESFASNQLTGGIGAGTEFYTWEGRPCGYEGVLVGQYPVLASIAVDIGQK
jgi:hypothetical protein